MEQVLQLGLADRMQKERSTSKMTTILKRARPILFTEASILGIFAILFLRLAIIEPNVHGEHIFWTLRGCLIGPFEMIVNPCLSQQALPPCIVMALLSLGMMSANIIRPSQVAAITSIFGTVCWNFCGLCGAWAWT